jgi:3',5'-cyclic AMP phosphodiesterase CpdA
MARFMMSQSSYTSHGQANPSRREARPFSFVHVSDPHLPLPGLVPPWRLLNKRLLGVLSWHVRKRQVHLACVLDAISADIRACGADHIAVTGDLTHVSLESEFRRARAWLESLGSSSCVTVIPGNHDTYVKLPWSKGLALWQDFITGAQDLAAREVPVQGREGFPFIRRRGPVAFIGLSSALPMPLATPAAGLLGPDQLARLQDALARLRHEGLFRAVLIHHAPNPRLSPRKALLDAEPFLDVLRAEGAELVLHGHLHEAGVMEVDGRDGAIPVIGVPSASALAHRGRPHARYHLCRVSGAAGSWDLCVDVREFDPETGGVRLLTPHHWRWQNHCLVHPT